TQLGGDSLRDLEVLDVAAGRGEKGDLEAAGIPGFGQQLLGFDRVKRPPAGLHRAVPEHPRRTRRVHHRAQVEQDAAEDGSFVDRIIEGLPDARIAERTPLSIQPDEDDAVGGGLHQRATPAHRTPSARGPPGPSAPPTAPPGSTPSRCATSPATARARPRTTPRRRAPPSPAPAPPRPRSQ